MAAYSSAVVTGPSSVSPVICDASAPSGVICDASAPNGQFEVEIAGGRAILSKLYYTYPLKLVPQQSQRPTTVLQMYMIGHGGGLVSGDKINMVLALNQSSALIMKTQGSTKVYKSQQGGEAAAPASQLISGHLRDESFLLSVPDPITCFADSSLQQLQTYKLSQNASCCLVEWFTCGRESSGEVWRASRIRSTVQIYVQDKMVLLENLDLQASSYGSFSDKIGGCVVFGSLMLVGPKTLNLRERLQVLKQRQSFSNLKSAKERTHDEGDHIDPIVSFSEVSEGAIMRFSGVSVEDCYCLLALIFNTMEKDLNVHPSPFMERIDSSSLSCRVQKKGSLFNVLALALSK